jgi:hypothetical protein
VLGALLKVLYKTTTLPGLSNDFLTLSHDLLVQADEIPILVSYIP